MSVPRKHHYVQQFYLRGFSEDGKSICQIEKPGGRAYTCSISDAAATRDYHEIDQPGSKDPHIVEKRLADIETQLSLVLASIIRSGITTSEVRVKLMEFVSLTRFRMPAFKAFVEEFHRQVAGSTGS